MNHALSLAYQRLIDEFYHLLYPRCRIAEVGIFFLVEVRRTFKVCA